MQKKEKYQVKSKINRKHQDLSGKRFGRITVLGLSERWDFGLLYWDVVCDCGKHKTMCGSQIKKPVKSCGECSDIKNMETGSRIKKCFDDMMSRCHNKKNSGYKNYGGRGIRVCKEWRYNYFVFKEWALSNGYEDNLTLDRFPDVNGWYSPNNCRWATRSEQNNNTTKSRYLTYDGQTKTVAQWAVHLGIKRYLINDRLNKLGWTIEDSLTQPLKKIFNGNRPNTKAKK